MLKQLTKNEREYTRKADLRMYVKSSTTNEGNTQERQPCVEIIMNEAGFRDGDADAGEKSGPPTAEE